MPVAPIGNNGQDQSLTVLLRNIISEYPAGGGVLRELCQNADDAGADTVEFVLDTSQHPTENLLHEDLAEFQGMSLLAYNNRPFSKSDFESLKRIGDSGKAKDLNTTGKFGRGFNSVYNWTDNPSILSGSSLLLLDPHKNWSSKVGFPGGPLYDFVANSDEPEIKNQLSAFGTILKRPDTDFPGTIIRLPLRNDAQAGRSEIVEDNISTSREEIEEVFQMFTDEIVESLLFLRNLRSITLRIDDIILAKAESAIINERKNNSGENSVNEAYREVFVEQSKELCETDFMMEISLYRAKKTNSDCSEVKTKYAISHHLRKSPEDEKLQGWARRHKLFPWIAIASPLERTPEFEGRLFTTLPLPIHTKHPVHIHGMFSITPDRSNIHSGGDYTMSANSGTRLGAQWNQWLLHECLPHAWVRNLSFLRSAGLAPGWDFWPAGKQGEGGGLWMGILGTVFERIVRSNLELLPTVSGAVKPCRSVTFTLDIPEDLHSSLRNAGALVVFPPDDRRNEIRTLNHGTMDLRYLTPQNGRRHLTELKNSNSLRELDIKSRMTLLDYVLSDEHIEDLQSCEAPLIPVSDGTFRGFEMPRSQDDRTFIARDAKEEALFENSPKTVDKSKISSKSQTLLVKHITELERHTRIKAWNVEEAARYCTSYIFDTVQEPLPVVYIENPKFNDFLDRFWEWISKVRRREADAPKLVNSLRDLWLIPLGRQRFQKFGSTDEYPVLNVSPDKGIGSFLKRAEAEPPERFQSEKMYLYTGNGFSKHTTKNLSELGFIKEYDDITSLMKWLEVTMEVFVDRLNHGEKEELATQLSHLLGSCNTLELSRMKSTVQRLTIFHEANELSPSERPWTSMSHDDPDHPVTYVGVKDLSITLNTPQHIFIDIKNNAIERLISQLPLANCPSLPEILADHVIPMISRTGTVDDERRMGFVRFALDNFRELSAEARSVLSEKEIVPTGTKKLKRPKDTVSGKPVVGLFFPQEERFPDVKFDESYHKELVCLGMPEEITGEVVLDRIQFYSNLESYPITSIDDKPSIMLKHGDPPRQPLSEEYRELRWIPATGLDRKLGLFSASQCRDKSRKKLCGYSMPIMEFSIGKVWAEWLGWNSPLSTDQLDRQLRGARKEKDYDALAHLVEYWSERYTQRGRPINPELRLDTRKWILGHSETFYSPTKIFFHNAQNLHPYYDKVNSQFLQGNLSVERVLRDVGVKPRPTYEQLKELQDVIAAKGPLSPDDLEVALNVVDLVARVHNDRNKDGFLDFKAPDDKEVMRALSELTVSADDDRGLLEDRPTLHPKISASTTKKLGLPTTDDRILAALRDPDFEQKQSSEAMIRDTLQWYSVESTFSEYLANAEDCMTKDGRRASRVDWILDSSNSYPKEKLINKALASAQGPALLCYNDGVFTDADFKAIIDIGVGSKREDFSKIGKYGKGALTMYHWTSAPSFVSGESFVIFDPENKFLQPHHLTRKPLGGLKLKIRDVQKQYPDQLKPFEGIFGFTKDSLSFEGTIFRFPFRQWIEETKLVKQNILGLDASEYLQGYQEKAQISLLFLEHISTISYWRKEYDEPIWQVSSSSQPVGKPRSPQINEVEITVTTSGYVQLHGSSPPTEKYRWWTIAGSTEEYQIPPELTDVAKHNRLEAKYGLAVPEHVQPGSCFMGLPLQMNHTLSLPVSINANMALQSDRNTPIADEDDRFNEGLDWNKWIFKEGIAPLYLFLLQHLMGRYGAGGYRFWPAHPSELKSSDMISQTISTGFWERAAKSRFELYPSVIPKKLDNQPPVTKNLTIKQALFDLLDPRESSFLVPILIDLGIDYIATPPDPAQAALKELDSISSITPAYVREVFHDPNQRGRLHDIWEKKPENLVSNLSKILEFVLQDTPSGSSLVGCSLIPLADGSLGTIAQKEPSRNEYFVAETPLERSILEISKDCLVSGDLEKFVVDRLLNLKLNICQLSFEHMAKLCEKVESKDPAYRKAWLVKLWRYFEICIRKKPEKVGEYLESIRLLPVYCGSIVGRPESLEFLTPSRFNSGCAPTIVRPQASHLGGGRGRLFDALNGLVLVESSTFPAKGLPAESIDTLTGVYRLVKAIGILPTPIGTDQSVSQILLNVPPDGIKALSKYILSHIKPLLRKYGSIANTLKHLPIWDINSCFQPATKLKLLPDQSLASTTMTDQSTFLSGRVATTYEEELRGLGVKILSWDEFLSEEIGLASGILPSEKIPAYQSFIEDLSRVNPDLFSSYKLGVDGDLHFCMLKTLYDRSEQLFQAAFRDQAKRRFLHPELAQSNAWRNTPLIREVSGRAYIQCAQSIERRQNISSVPDIQTTTDTQIVFKHLLWDHREMQKWDQSIWNALVKIRFAPVQKPDSSHSKLRNEQINRFFQRGKVIAIEEAALQQDESIPWSQRPVLGESVGSLALGKIKSATATITPQIVIRHLEFLASRKGEMVEDELQERFAEIKKAYEYLEGQIPRHTIDEMAIIWLNINNEDSWQMSMETFRKSWSCTRDLCLGIPYDSGPVKSVRSFLTLFHKLLLHARVPRLKPLDLDLVAPPEPSDNQSRLLEGLIRFQKEGTLVDATIIAQEPNCHCRKFRDATIIAQEPNCHCRKFKVHKAGILCDATIIAQESNCHCRKFIVHKAVLAAVSEYWRAMFMQPLMESINSEVFLEEDPNTVDVLIKYIYTGKLTPASRTEDVTADLDNLLDQLVTSDKWLLKDLNLQLQHSLCDSHWIRPETVRPVLRCARDSNANTLADVCEKYIRDNRAIVDREGEPVDA